MPPKRLKNKVGIAINIETEHKALLDGYVGREKQRRQDNSQQRKYGPIYNNSVFLEEAIERAIRGE